MSAKFIEDNALGRLPDARYAALDAQYAKEQEKLAVEMAELKKAVSNYDQGNMSVTVRAVLKPSRR